MFVHKYCNAIDRFKGPDLLNNRNPVDFNMLYGTHQINITVSVKTTKLSESWRCKMNSYLNLVDLSIL